MGESEPATGSSRKRLNLPKSYWYTLVVFLVFSLANSSDAFLLLRIQELGTRLGGRDVLCPLQYRLFDPILSRWFVERSNREMRVIGLAGSCMPSSTPHLPGCRYHKPGSVASHGLYGAYMALTEGVEGVDR